MKYPQLNNSETLFKNIFAFYGTFDKNCIITGINGKILDSTDFDDKQLAGQNFLELAFWKTDSLNSENLRKAVKVAFERGFSKLFLSFRINDKTQRYLDLNLSVSTDQNNDFQEIFFCATDVSTKIQEINFYKERSEHFLYAAENAGIGLWFWDLKKDEIFSTPRCNELFDLAHHEIITFSHFLDVLHPEDKSRVEDALLKSQTTGQEYSIEYRVIHSDGNIHWVSAKGKCFLDTDSKPQSMMGSVRRITDEKIAASEFERIYQLESKSRKAAIQANQAKDYFLALVSHELRSPLNSILGWTQILAKQNLDQKTQEKAIETITRSAKSQAKLIEDLVDSARITSGKLRLEFHPVNLFKVINEVYRQHQPLADEKGIKFDFTSSTEMVEIIGDLNRLQQIFNNLLNNSIKFTPAGGQINIDLKQIGEKVIVRVKDTGEGIKEEDLPNIFDRFSQGENKTTKEKKGLGLGLSIARILTENHRGKISVESEGIDQGAEFKLTFPIHIGDENKIRKSEKEEGIFNDGILTNLNIFILEDDQDSREVLEIFLTQTGATVVSAESVQKALAALTNEGQKFDIIISDLAMPEEDGFSFLTKVRQDSNLQNIPAIALSAFTSGEKKQKAFQVGFQKYHTKPFSPDLLIDEIVELTKRV
jgi:PAS domain S-box-containing protein